MKPKRTFTTPALLALVMLLIAPDAQAACVNVPDRGAVLYQECKLTKTVIEPGAELIVSFPRGDRDPTFSVFLEWLPCGDPDGTPCLEEGDRCELYVEVDRLPTNTFPRFDLIDEPFHLNSSTTRRTVQGGNFTRQVVARNGRTFRAQDMAVRFDNGLCWAALHLKYAERLGLLYR